MLENQIEDQLFSEELAVFELAMTNLNNERYKDNELLDSYRDLTLNYDKLLRVVRKSIKISDFQWKELIRKENEIRLLLDNSSQGFLTFSKDLIVNKEHSGECIKLFGKKISNVSILELLSNENSYQNELFNSIFTEFFSTNDVNEKLSCLSKLPNILHINGKYVNIAYKPVNQYHNTDASELLMLIITDITEKKRAEDEVLYLSYHDKLTSLYNRAYIDSIIPQLLTESNMPLSIIMGDMNGLKLTNDVFGHQYGDKLIVTAAEVLSSCCSSSDIVARWGGDEFLIILPRTSNLKAMEICQRIKNTCGLNELNSIELSISLGIATIEKPCTSISEIFNIAENMMYSNKLIESKSVRKKIILSLEKTLVEKCFENYGHIHRVKMMAIKFGEIMKFNPDSEEMIALSMLSYLHDIGKVSLPKEILGKQGTLNEVEWGIIKSYTKIGYRMAQSIGEPIIAEAILSLRERWDGSGYPYGIKEENIPLIARILSIIDAYDVMTHDRPYRKALSKKEALSELNRLSGTHFDPKLVNIFVNEKIYN